MKNLNIVYAFACFVKRKSDWGLTIYNARSANEAKRLHFKSVTEIYPQIKYTDVRARKLGIPHTSEAFKHTAQHRGMPGLLCGDVVKVGLSKGVVVGHTASACFEVLFFEGAYKDIRMSVHPAELVVLDETQGPVLDAWTDYPIIPLGDESGKIAPVRACKILSYDRNKYCRVEVDGVIEEIKRCYLYSKPGRVGEVKVVSDKKLETLPIYH